MQVDDPTIDIFDIPETVRDIAIEHFPLSTHIYNQLKTAKICTLSEMVRTLGRGSRSLNPSQKERVRALVRGFLSSVDNEGYADWKAFCDTQEISFIPSEIKIESDSSILANLGKVVEEILTNEKDKRQW